MTVQPHVHVKVFELTRVVVFRSEGELRELVREVRGQLKKVAITANNRKDRVFLGIDVNRQGFISKANLHEMCLKQHLPADPQIIDRVRPATPKDTTNPEEINDNSLNVFVPCSWQQRSVQSVPSAFRWKICARSSKAPKLLPP